MGYIGSGGVEKVLVRCKFLDQLTRYAGASLVLVDGDTFLRTPCEALHDGTMKATNGDDVLPRRVSRGGRLAGRLLSGQLLGHRCL